MTAAGSPSVIPASSPKRRRKSLPALLVMTGTFAAPLAQWYVFFLIARIGGSADAGIFGLLFAVATPIVTMTNWGLRNGYITLNQRPRFADVVLTRVLGIVIASVALFAFGACAKIDMGMVAAVVLMKAADSMTDIWYGRWQHQQRLRPFGGMMFVNGIVTIGCASLFGLVGLSSAWIVFGSALGSSVTLAAVVALDATDIISWLRRDGHAFRGAARRMWGIIVGCWQICAAQVLAGLIIYIPTWAVALFGTPEDVGRFAAAAYMLTAGSLLGSSLNAVVLGDYRAEMVSGGSAAVRRSVRRGNLIVTGAGAVAVVTVGFAGVWVFQSIYGAQFAFTPSGLVLIAVAAALNPGTQLMNAALLAVNAYIAQLAIVGVALIGSASVALVAGSLHLSGFLVGALCALAGSLLKYGLSSVCLRRAVGPDPMRTK